MGIAACRDYAQRLARVLDQQDWSGVERLAEDMRAAWTFHRQIFLCGNGGSAGNAVHLANDFVYGVAKNNNGQGMRIHALPANTAVMTCLANDISYDEVFSQQLKVMAQKDDVLVVLSGSGNSPNVVRALEVGRDLGMRTSAILGYSGGKCKELADNVIHVPVDDMQISEDMQLIVGHMLMQQLCDHPPG